MKPDLTIPPRHAQRFLHWFLKDDLSEEVLGDLEEQYYARLGKNGPWKAHLYYWYEVFNYLRPFAIKKLSAIGHFPIYNDDMFQHYITATFRNLRKEKVFTLINLAGLTLGLLCSLAIYLWVKSELSVDRFHHDIDRMARVMSSLRETDDNIITYDDSQGPVAEAAHQQIPEVEMACRIIDQPQTLITVEDQSFTENGMAADPNLFQMFTFPLIEGDTASALGGADNIAISETLAKKYFGNASPLGKMLRLNNAKEAVVTAVFQDVPQNASFSFDFVTPVETYIRENNIKLAWGNFPFYTYVKLTNAASFESANAKFRELMKNNNPEDDGAEWLFLQRLNEAHLYNRFVNGIAEGGNIEYVRVFALAAIFILVMACINFVNLSTAQASRRSREVGIRKVNGALKTQLIFQFLIESMLLTLICILSALGMLYLVLPSLNAGLSIHLSLDFTDPSLWGVLAVTFVVTGLAAGLYPAFVLSAFRPAKVLKGLAGSSGNTRLRKGLVTFQFVLSALLLICTFVIFRQISFIQHKNMGYNRDQVLYFYPHQVSEHFDAFRNELTAYPAILRIGTSSKNPVNVGNATTSVGWPGKVDDAIIQFRAIEVSYDFLETIQLPILEGRTFTRDFPVQDSLHQYIVTHEAAQRMQLDNPVGQQITLWGEPGIIVGMAADFHSRSIHTAVDPVIFKLNPGQGAVYVKVEKEKTSEAIQVLEATYKKYETAYPFAYHFLDETFENIYSSESFAEKLALAFACMAILISVLGLFGLSYFSVEKRRKEIGIRKVLGATLPHLLTLLSRETLLLILAANVLAWPLGWYVVTQWLERFAYRVTIGPEIYVMVSLVTVFVALAVVSSQTIRAAWMNPVKTLRQE